MIGRFNFTDIRLSTLDDGTHEVTLTVSKDSYYAVKQIVREIRKQDREYTAKIDIRKNSRSLDQNALMWALLTIYAEALGGGRRGSVQPEDIYYQMLEKYGVATFLMALPEVEEELKKTFRVVKVVDERVYNGKQMKVFKCYFGSSTYTTEQMSQLIDGIFDELAQLGINPNTSQKLTEYYQEWTRR